jgi:hypothetical protein
MKKRSPNRYKPTIGDRQRQARHDGRDFEVVTALEAGDANDERLFRVVLGEDDGDHQLVPDPEGVDDPSRRERRTQSSRTMSRKLLSSGLQPAVHPSSQF